MSENSLSREQLVCENAALQAENSRLRAEERRYRATLFSIGDGVIVTDDCGRVLQMNPMAEALTGWSEASAKGRPSEEVFRILHEEARSPVESPVSRVLREGVVVGLANHTVLVARNGTERPIAESGAPIRDTDGASLGVVLVFRDQTAERRAEAELRHAEEKSRTFFDLAPIGKCMTSPDGGLLCVNQALCSMLGYSADALQSKTFEAVTHPDDLPETQECVRSLLAGERDTWSMQKRYIARDGHAVWTQVTTRLQRDCDGKPLHFLTHILDISEQKRAEEALLRSERLLNRAQQVAKLGGWEYDVANRSVAWSDEVYRIHGVSKDYDPSHPEQDIKFYTSEDQQRVTEAFARAVAEGEPYDLEVQLISAQGIRQWVRTIGQVERQGDAIVRVFGTISDITERKQSEAATAQLAAIVEWSDDAILSKSLDGTVTSWNQGAERLFGFRADGIIGRSVSLIVPEDRATEELEILEQIKSGKGVKRLETVRQRKDGSLVDVSVTVSSIRDHYGQIVGMSKIARDITDRKQAEERLQKANEALLRSNQELEQFANVASHDLQEPLRMVSSYTQLLSQRYEAQLDQDARDFIGYAVDGANRMQRLIQDLLSYSRVTSRGQPPTKFDVHEAMGDAVVNLQAMIQETGALVTNDELPTVVGDSGQLTQVFQNLIGNGVKFHKPSVTPLVHVSVERESNGPFVTFSVADNGIGIDPKYFDRMFVIFQRLHTKREYPGTGIGLALCKRIIERHGGRIWLESVPERGTTVKFTLRAAIEDKGTPR